jgi:hypothetical protein
MYIPSYIPTNRWSNEKIETRFARDGRIAPVDVLLNIGAVIRRWHANRKWLLFEVGDKSYSNTTIQRFFLHPFSICFYLLQSACVHRCRSLNWGSCYELVGTLNVWVWINSPFNQCTGLELKRRRQESSGLGVYYWKTQKKLWLLFIIMKRQIKTTFFIMNRYLRESNWSFVYYESIKRDLKRRPIYECRCDERLKTVCLFIMNQ